MLHSITEKFTDGWIKTQCSETDGYGEKIQGPDMNMRQSEGKSVRGASEKGGVQR